MSEHDPAEPDGALKGIKSQAASGLLRLTQHAQQEMVEEEISLDEVFEAIGRAEILEYYPEHRRGPRCLLGGLTDAGRPMHAVCTTAQPLLVLITIYEPKPPKWTTPRTRRKPQ